MMDRDIFCQIYRSTQTKPHHFSKTIICLFLHLGCTATDPYSGSCCNFLPEKCGENEGECDSDADCKAGLSCGIDNCPAWGNFHHDADCCFNVTGIIFIPYFTQLCLQ